MGDLGQIVPMKYNPRDENSIKVVMAKANVVINLIGREYETRNFGFQEVNHHIAENLAVISTMSENRKVAELEEQLQKQAANSEARIVEQAATLKAHEAHLQQFKAMFEQFMNGSTSTPPS